MSGTAVWDAMCADADAYRMPVTLKNGKTAERGLRADAVIGWAMIIKPPLEMIAELGMTDKDIRQFCSDGFRAMGEIEPRLFRMDNLEALGTHRDEDGTHLHACGTSKDKDGRYCGNLIDAALCVRINQQFPALMRGMGWPIDDIDLTDWERMKTDEAYKKEREAKRKRQGNSVNQYAKSKAANASRVAAKIITDAKDEAQAIKEDARREAERDAARIKAQAVKEAREDAQAEQLKVAAEWEGGILDAQRRKAALERDIGDLTEYKSQKAQKAAQEAQERAERKKAEEEARKAEKRRIEAQKAQDEARQRQEAQRAARAAQEAARPKSREEMYQEAMRAVNGGASTLPPRRPRKPSAQEQLRKATRETDERAASGLTSVDGPTK